MIHSLKSKKILISSILPFLWLANGDEGGEETGDSVAVGIVNFLFVGEVEAIFVLLFPT